MKKVIVFDTWGTTIEQGVNPSPSKQVKNILRIKEQFSDFIIRFEEVFMTESYETLTDGFKAVSEAFNLKTPDFVYEKLVGMWNKNAILATSYEDTEPTLKELKSKGYTLVLLSNMDKFSHEHLKSKLNFELFDHTLLSYQTGILKNNPESFEKIMELTKTKEEDLIMVGDSVQSDIKAAEEANVDSVLVDRRQTREYENKISDLTELYSYLQA